MDKSQKRESKVMKGRVQSGFERSDCQASSCPSLLQREQLGRAV
jgi:hypothetical protein